MTSSDIICKKKKKRVTFVMIGLTVLLLCSRCNFSIVHDCIRIQSMIFLYLSITKLCPFPRETMSVLVIFKLFGEGIEIEKSCAMQTKLSASFKSLTGEFSIYIFFLNLID